MQINLTLTDVATITFLVDATQSTAATIFYLKGNWATATGVYDNAWEGGSEHTTFYDDGTHGDAEASDHIFTTQCQLIPDGGANTWERGINDINHNWVNGNFIFNVTDNSNQTLTYQIPGLGTYAVTFNVANSSGIIQGAKITIGSGSIFTNPSGMASLT